MKIKVFLITVGIMFSLGGALYATSKLPANQSKLIAQGEQLPVDKMERLSYLHNQLLSLPGDRDKIMKEMQDLRSQRAPHFPQRAQTGSDKVVIDKAFKKWITDYPREYDMYTRGLIEMKNKYTN